MRALLLTIILRRFLVGAKVVVASSIAVATLPCNEENTQNVLAETTGGPILVCQKILIISEQEFIDRKELLINPILWNQVGIPRLILDEAVASRIRLPELRDVTGAVTEIVMAIWEQRVERYLLLLPSREMTASSSGQIRIRIPFATLKRHLEASPAPEKALRIVAEIEVETIRKIQPSVKNAVKRGASFRYKIPILIRVVPKI